MKLLGVFGLLSSCLVASLAQSVPDVDKAPGLIVTKHNFTVKLQQYVTYIRGNLPDAGRGPTAKDSDIGLHPMEGARPVMKTRMLFLYAVEVQNVGALKIDAVVWDYSFARADDDKELGRLRFLNRSSIKPGKSKRLSSQTLERPPLSEVSMVVNARDLGKKEVSPYSEKVEIKCILYADGTWWRHPTLLRGDCESLLKDKPRKGR